MAQLKIIKGDATHPIGEGTKRIIVPHICNDIGAWGKGFVNAITARWGTEPREEYLLWSKDKDSFVLGEVQFVEVPNRIIIANMLAQHGIYSNDAGRPPIRYAALAFAMEKVKEEIEDICLFSDFKGETEIHTCKFGSGLAMGNWEIIEAMIMELWVDDGIDVTIYDPDLISG